MISNLHAGLRKSSAKCYICNKVLDKLVKTTDESFSLSDYLFDN